MSTPQKVIAAYEAWQLVEDTSISTDAIVEALDELVRCCRNVDETEELVRAAEDLRQAYNHGWTQYWNDRRASLVSAYDNWRF